MPKLVPTVGTVVIRDGKRVRPAIGKAYDFTKEEADSIKESMPNALRKPTNEDDGDDTAVASAEVSQAKARGGKKAATAAKADGEVTDTDPPAKGDGSKTGAGTDDDL